MSLHSGQFLAGDDAWREYVQVLTVAYRSRSTADYTKNPAAKALNDGKLTSLTKKVVFRVFVSPPETVAGHGITIQVRSLCEMER
ncbi:hypothetical protein H097_07765 [Pseudomonas sp. FH4]|nr:hypothetical protein H097_07765 [Pseudomonas sp. FH4]